MKTRTTFLVLALVIVGAASFTVWRTVSASTRQVTPTWSLSGTDPHWDGTPAFLDVTAESDAGTDTTINLELRDANGGLVIATNFGNDTSNPFDSGDIVHLKAGLLNYGSGQTFTCTGTFRDSSGAVTGVVQTPFTKP